MATHDSTGFWRSMRSVPANGRAFSSCTAAPASTITRADGAAVRRVGLCGVCVRHVRRRRDGEPRTDHPPHRRPSEQPHGAGSTRAVGDRDPVIATGSRRPHRRGRLLFRWHDRPRVRAQRVDDQRRRVCPRQSRNDQSCRAVIDSREHSGLPRSPRPARADVAGHGVCRGDEERGRGLSVDCLRERDAWFHARDRDGSAARRAVSRANRRAVIDRDSDFLRELFDE